MKKKRELTPEQEAARDKRREQFKTLIKTISEMSDESKQKFIEKIGVIPMVTGHALSVYNSCMVVAQCEGRPCPALVGGFQQWREQGRKVKKGEAGLMIWIPKHGKKEGDSAPKDGEKSSQKEKGSNFFPGYVWDIAQTELIEAEVAAI